MLPAVASSRLRASCGFLRSYDWRLMSHDNHKYFFNRLINIFYDAPISIYNVPSIFCSCRFAAYKGGVGGALCRPCRALVGFAALRPAARPPDSGRSAGFAGALAARAPLLAYGIQQRKQTQGACRPPYPPLLRLVGSASVSLTSSPLPAAECALALSRLVSL